jgi:hypothetical protein
LREFWVSSGHHLTRRHEGGGLLATDELLLAFLARPELAPPDEACDAERRLHAALLADPRRPVAAPDLAALADPDARENWEVMIGFRDLLLRTPTLEAAYLEIVRTPPVTVPVLFLNQLVQLILRNALDECADPYVLRAAELFFRPQKASLQDGSLLLADADLVEAEERRAGQSPLLAMLGREPVAELDVMDDANAWTYWSRSDAFTMAMNLGANPTARAGLARAIEAWLAHLLDLPATVEPVGEIRDDDWRWFVGLDAEGTRLGNAVWRGETLSDEARSRIVALFRLVVSDRGRLDDKVGDRPIYLFMGMSPDRRVTMKPQNLIVGLPLGAGTRPA